MQRYQIYLDPDSVEIIDDVATELQVNRSHIIRSVIDRVSNEYKKVLTARPSFSIKNHPLMKMAGIGKSKTGTAASGIDEIYTQD